MVRKEERMFGTRIKVCKTSQGGVRSMQIVTMVKEKE
jgi:hypothetical protein